MLFFGVASTDSRRRLMAHEYVLKMLVDGLANTAHDFQTFATLLNQRAELYGAKTLFAATKYRAPGPKYPSREESATRAAEARTDPVRTTRRNRLQRDGSDTGSGRWSA